VIVRLMGEGQYRVDESLQERLNELDDRAGAALEANDEIALDRALDEMFALVRREGEKLPDDDLSTSDTVIPPSDTTLEEARQLMSQEGYIPDVAAV
jgi:PspAA-like protein